MPSVPLRALCACALLFAAARCGDGGDHADGGPDAPATRPATPDPWAGELRLPGAEDRNPDPRVVEIDLEARLGEWEIAPGRRVRAMTYNGSVPGPLIEARVGDTLVVHFRNRLAEPTTIHWHGVRVPNDMDGPPEVQPVVMPGGAFEYRFALLDAGTFWYHPHVDESVQMERGLYGAIVVRGQHEPAVDREGVLVLDDVRLGADGQIAPPGGLTEHHAGREGDVRLVNGRAGATLPIRAGQRQRWRVVNASSARYYRLGLAGHRFTLLGTDGGLLPAPREVDDVLLVPGDRVDLVVTGTGAPGSAAVVETLPYDRGHGAGTVTAEPVLRVQYEPDPPLEVLPLPAAFAPVERLATEGVAPREITFDEVTDRAAQTVTFRINGQSHPDVPPIHARVGATEVWELHNESGMDHPFHLHGYFFQVLARDGVPEPNPTWEDTENLRGHGRLRIAFRPEGRPGMWMYHCHILEHVARGMMAMVHVAP